jgi:hypothetical protein
MKKLLALAAALIAANMAIATAETYPLAELIERLVGSALQVHPADFGMSRVAVLGSRPKSASNDYEPDGRASPAESACASKQSIHAPRSFVASASI